MPEEQLQARSETRRLAAIMFTDIVGFSRQMGVDEARMLRLLDVHNQLIQTNTRSFSPSSCPSPSGRRNSSSYLHEKCQTVLPQ